MFSRLGLVVTLSLLSLSCAQVEERVVTALFENYVSAQEALAADDLVTAKNAFRLLADETNPELQALAKQLAESSSLEEARSKFKPLSEKVVELDLPKGYSVVRCPMADEGQGARWVQKDGEIANPYFGEEMLKCGSVEKTGK